MKLLPVSAVLSLLVWLTSGYSRQANPDFDFFQRFVQTGEIGPTRVATADEFVRMLASSGTAWLNAGIGLERERRRKILALVTFETASQATSSSRDAFTVIEWACQLLRKGPPSEFER